MQPVQLGYKNEEERRIVADIYRSFGTAFDRDGNPTEYQQWFRAAGIVEKHPVKMCRTIQINCNYKPLLMMKEVMAIADRHGLPVFLQEVDANGYPKD